MRIPLLDLKAQHAAIRAEVEAAVKAVFDDQQFVLGATVERFEEEMRAYTGAAHAIGVASGSDALLLALLALEIGPQDAVVTTPFTFFATAGSIVRAGARLLFGDIDPATFNLAPESVAAVLRDAAREARRVVLMPVHLYGRLAPMSALSLLAAEHGAAIVEDAAQAIGARAATERGSRMAGTFGLFGALSFFPSKNLGAAGDAGMVLCEEEEMAHRVRLLRTHGSLRRYVHDRVGVNSRLDALQAAVLSVKLKHLETWNRARRERAAAYERRLRDAGLDRQGVVLPELAGEEHVFHQFVIRVERRDQLREALAEAGVETQVYYPVPLHRQPCFADLGFRDGDFPQAERVCRECLALPIFPELSDDQIDYVVETIAAFHRAR
ncbi:MAG: DegT/DnrJ/EryC1/StrS family aminotransferase [Deltaproteobacteria bacterium]|nr:DegT/DnrJ/EryC1/StrS family aminotransferase [Deltaproteobacteria bacterium]